MGKVPDRNSDGTGSQHRAYAAEGTHLICRSPALRHKEHSAAGPLTLLLTTENSTIQASIPRHLAENTVLQKEALLIPRDSSHYPNTK